MCSWHSMCPFLFKAKRRGLVGVDGVKIGGSVEGAAVEKAGNLISSELGGGLIVDKFDGFDGNTNSEVTVLAGFVGD